MISYRQLKCKCIKWYLCLRELFVFLVIPPPGLPPNVSLAQPPPMLQPGTFIGCFFHIFVTYFAFFFLPYSAY